MTRPLVAFLACLLATVSGAVAAPKGGKSGPKKVELPHPFYWAIPDPLRGDYAGADSSGVVAQVIRKDDRILSVENVLPVADDVGRYVVHVFKAFDQPHDKPVAVLEGKKARGDGAVTLSGDGWSGQLSEGTLSLKAAEGTTVSLQHVMRAPPSLGAKPPAEAVVLFDGRDMKEWAHRSDKDWLKADGPPTWKLLGDGSMEISPNQGYLLSRKTFKDFKLHLEFRNLGGPTNSGVYIFSRYEANINEMYGRLDGNPCTQFDNCTDKDASPGIRCSRPPLDWQTMDIEFHAPRFKGTGDDAEMTQKARATVYFNGTLYYHEKELGPLLLNAAKLGEAPSGPIMLQEHGMPVQFRNIWLVELP